MSPPEPMTAFLADLKDFGMSEAIEPVQRIRRTDWYRNRKVYGPEQAPQDSGDMGCRFIYASWGMWMEGERWNSHCKFTGRYWINNEQLMVDVSETGRVESEEKGHGEVMLDGITITPCRGGRWAWAIRATAMEWTPIT